MIFFTLNDIRTKIRQGNKVSSSESAKILGRLDRPNRY